MYTEYKNILSSLCLTRAPCSRVMHHSKLSVHHNQVAVSH